MPKRTWKDQDLIKAFETAVSVAEILRALGLAPKGGNYNTIKRHLSRLSLDLRDVKKRFKASNNHFKPLSYYLKEGTHIGSSALKRRLLESEVLPNVCDICGITKWCGSDIVLQLDHINGIRADNRLENLRIVCPNCHSQTDTYCGRNIGRVKCQ